MTDASRFKGRNAVVTGGASGIGFGVAQRLAAEGAQVWLWDRDAERLKEAATKLGDAAYAITLDHDNVYVTTAFAASNTSRWCRSWGSRASASTSTGASSPGTGSVSRT